MIKIIKKIYFILVFFMFQLELNAEFNVKSLQEIRNNIIRQKYEESCGAASLANLLNFFSIKRFNEEDIIKILDNKTDILSFKELKEAAEKLGFNARAFQVSNDILEYSNLPFLAKIESDPRFPHFVVVLNKNGDFFQIYDPNFGAYVSHKKEFYSIWNKNNNGGFILLINSDKIISKNIELNIPNSIFFNKF